MKPLVAGIVGAVGALAAYLSFDGAMRATSTDAFCTSCHAMSAFALAEYRESPHYANDLGMRATCADCHVPVGFVPKLGKKIESVRELIVHWQGTMDTPEGYEAHRAEMAEREWNRLRGNDSAECRACHEPAAMTRTAALHERLLARGGTCIDCHQGIAHRAPGAEEAE